MLTKRLTKILSAVPKCDVLCDVGCDHGYVGIEVLKRDVCRQVIFCDISAPSLQKAQENCPDALKTRAQFVCQDGLDKIKCNCAVIAGMGGLEIISVLQGAESLPNTLILQPMRNQQDVRIWLAKKYKILTDEKFFDGKYYDLIVAQLGEGETLTRDEVKFGRSNIKRPNRDFKSYIEKEKQKYQQIRQACRNAQVEETYSDLCRVGQQIESEDKQ